MSCKIQQDHPKTKYHERPTGHKKNMTAFIVFRWSTSAETRENKTHKVREKEKKRAQDQP